MVFWLFCLEEVKVLGVCHTLREFLRMSIFLQSITVHYTPFQLLGLNYNFGEEEQEEEERLTTKAFLGSRTHVLRMNFAIFFSVMKANTMEAFDDALGRAYRHNKSRWSLHQVWFLEIKEFCNFSDLVWRIDKRTMGFFSALILLLFCMVVKLWLIVLTLSLWL